MLWLILTVALITRVWGTWFGYPEIIHPDEHHITDRVLLMLKAPEYDLNPHFFEYPSLYFYLLALLYLATGLVLSASGVIGGLHEFYEFAWQNLFYFHLLGRVLTAAFGVATVYLTFLTARKLWGQTAALLAAWFLCLGYLHFTDSHYISTDVPSAFFVLWAVYLAVTAVQTRRMKTLLFAAFASGLAAAVKYPNGLVLLSVVFAAVLFQRSGGNEGKGHFFRLFIRLSALAAFGFLLGTPYAVLDFRTFSKDLIGQLLHSDLGHLGVEETGFFGYFTLLVPSGGIGVPLILAALLGLFCSLYRREALDGLLLSFPLFFYLLLGNSVLKVDRYLIPAIPFFCIYAGVFVERIAAHVRARPRAALVALTVLLSAQPAYYLLQWCRIVMQPDTRNEAALWIEENIPYETLIASRIGSWKFPKLNEEKRKLHQLEMFTEESMRARLAFKIELLQSPVTAWILRSVFKDSVRIEELQALLERQPTFKNWRAPVLEELRHEGVQVIITSSLLEERFYSSTLEGKYPEMAKSWQNFFESVAREGRLLKEFAPLPNLHHPWGLGFLERPAIRIYAMQ